MLELMRWNAFYNHMVRDSSVATTSLQKEMTGEACNLPILVDLVGVENPWTCRG